MTLPKLQSTTIQIAHRVIQIAHWVIKITHRVEQLEDEERRNSKAFYPLDLRGNTEMRRQIEGEDGVLAREEGGEGLSRLVARHAGVFFSFFFCRSCGRLAVHTPVARCI